MPSDAEQAVYSERLWPTPGIWAATIAFGAGLGLIPAPISTQAALITAGLGFVGCVTLFVITTPTVRVTTETLIAGRAKVPVSLVSGIEELDPGQMRQARGVRLDARAYLCIRGWLPVGVKVFLADPEDPTPYWLISSRRPEALASALRATIDRVSPAE
jgi:hypothetical protein